MNKIINTPNKPNILTQIHEISQLSSLQLSMSESIPSNLSASSPIKPNRITATLSTDIKSINPTASNIQLNFVDQTNLLDSTIKQKIQSQHIYKQQCTPTTSSFKQSNDNIILTNSAPNANNIQLTKSSSQIILQTQIIKLQNKCITLIGIIHQISKEYHVDLSRFGYDNIIYIDSDKKVNQSSISHVSNASNASNSNSQFIYQDKDKQATELSFQQQLESFSYLENYISNYKQQLLVYQNSITEMHNKYYKNIAQTKRQIENISKKLQEVTEQLENQRKNNKQMGKRNEQLLLELEKANEQLQMYINKDTTLENSRNLHTLSPQQNHKIRESRNKNYRYHTLNDDILYRLPLTLNRHRTQPQQDLDISTNTKYSYMYRIPQTPTMQQKITQQSFTLRQYQGCLKQMQNIIQKLTTKLQHQIKSKTNLLNEIDRLCQSINKSQLQIQYKNNKIYQLQKQILMGQSQQLKKSRQKKQVMIFRLRDNRNKKQYQNIQSTNQRYTQEMNRRYQSLNKFSQSCRMRMNTNDSRQGQHQMIATFNGYNQYYGTRQNQVYRPRQISNGIRDNKYNYNYPLNKPKPSLNYAFNDYQQQ